MLSIDIENDDTTPPIGAGKVIWTVALVSGAVLHVAVALFFLLGN